MTKHTHGPAKSVQLRRRKLTMRNLEEANMKALTICQPYAELVLRGEKPVENRTWEMTYRGPLLIHAGKSRAWLTPPSEQGRDKHCCPGSLCARASHGPCDGVYGIPLAHMSFGALVGIAEVKDCVLASEIVHRYPRLAGNQHVEGPWCIVLSNVRRFSSGIPYRGQQGLFHVDESVVRAAIQTSEAVR